MHHLPSRNSSLYVFICAWPCQSPKLARCYPVWSVKLTNISCVSPLAFSSARPCFSCVHDGGRSLHRHQWQNHISGLPESLQPLQGVHSQRPQSVHREGVGVHLLCLASGIRGFLLHRGETNESNTYPCVHSAKYWLCQKSRTFLYTLSAC